MKTTFRCDKPTLLTIASAVTGLFIAMPAFADAEVDALKKELAEQRVLIDRLIAAGKKPDDANAQAATGANPITTGNLDDKAEKRRPVNPSTTVNPMAIATEIETAPEKPVFTLYGVADVSTTSMDTGYGRKQSLGSGGFAATRLGARIEQHLGGRSLKAVALLEAGMFLDTGSTGNGAVVPGINNSTPSTGGQTGTGSQLFSRQVYAGLSGDLGALTIGRQYSGSYCVAGTTGAAKGDGLYGYAAGFGGLVGGMPTRVNNSLVYWSPVVKGFSTQLLLTSGSENNVNSSVPVGATSTDDKAGRGGDAAVYYANGHLNLAATAWTIYNGSFATTGETALAKKRGVQFAANYDFGVARVFGDLIMGRISGGNYENVTKTLSKAVAWSVSALVPVGKHRFVATYSAMNDESAQDKDASTFALGYWYELAVNTRLYASVGKVHNNHNASYGLPDGGNLVGSVGRPGFGPSGLLAGVNFAF
jgi:hypothetical protein